MMLAIPFAPPFDNIYKFRAIAGLLMMIIAGFLLVQQVRWHRDLVREVEMEMVRQAPLDALVLAQFREQSGGTPPDAALERQLAEMRSRGDERSQILTNLVEDQEETTRILIPALTVFLVLGAAFFLWGTHDWSTKVQEPETDLLRLKVRQSLPEDLMAARANNEQVNADAIHARLAELDRTSKRSWSRRSRKKV